jgi:hypothetical protein
MNMGADGNRTTSQMSRDSMQMSEASRGSVFSILSDDSQDMEMVGVLQGPRQNSSLYGTHFEDEFASVTTKSDVESTFQSSCGGNNRRSGPSPPPMPPTRPFPQSQSAPVPVSKTAQSRYYGKPLQQQEMDTFSSLNQADYGSSANIGTTQYRVAPPQAPPQSDQRDTFNVDRSQRGRGLGIQSFR